MKVWLVKV